MKRPRMPRSLTATRLRLEPMAWAAVTLRSRMRGVTTQKIMAEILFGTEPPITKDEMRGATEAVKELIEANALDYARLIAKCRLAAAERRKASWYDRRRARDSVPPLPNFNAAPASKPEEPADPFGDPFYE